MNYKLKAVIALATLSIASSSVFADVVQLDVTAWKGNEAEPAGMPELVEKFNASHPDINAELTYISRTDTDVVIPPRLQGDNAPDVLMVDMPLVKLWGDAGLLMDFGTDAEWYDRVSPDLASAITLDGKLYIMPLETIGMGLFTNMGLLKEVGIENPPKTIEELKTTCGALDQAGKKAMLMTGGFPTTLFVIANGVEAATTPVEELGNTKASFVNDAGFNATLDTLRELADAKCFDPVVMAGVDPWSTALNEFKAGNFAMLPQGAWNIGNFRESENLEFVFGPIPTRAGNGAATDLFGIGWAVSANSAKQEAARTFVEYFAQPENLQVVLDAESAYSPFNDGASGTPELAAPYDTARIEGTVVNYPFSVLQWPSALDKEMWDSLTGFLLDLSKDNEEVLVRWDETVEDNQ